MSLNITCPYCKSRDLSVKSEKVKDGHEVFFTFCEDCEQKGPPRLSNTLAIESHKKSEHKEESKSFLKKLLL